VLTPHIYASLGSWANRTLRWDEVLICYDAPDSVVTALTPHAALLDKAFFDGIVWGESKVETETETERKVQTEKVAQRSPKRCKLESKASLDFPNAAGALESTPITVDSDSDASSIDSDCLLDLEPRTIDYDSDDSDDSSVDANDDSLPGLQDFASRVETKESFVEISEKLKASVSNLHERLPDLEPRTIDHDSDDSDDSSVDAHNDSLPGLQDFFSRVETKESFVEITENLKASVSNLHERATLDHIEREARQRKATKSNDAEIPAYLWEEHLLQDGPTPWDTTTTDIPKLMLGMELMRRRMLKWWKQKVTRTFLHSVAASYDTVTKIDEWAEIQDSGRGIYGLQSNPSTRLLEEKQVWKQSDQVSAKENPGNTS
jgi:hypothetical protein